MKKKFTTCLKTFLIIFVILIETYTPVYADMNTFLDSFTIQYSNPNANWKDGFVWGGSITVKYPQHNFRFFSVTPPSIRAGCGGIDIVFGGFQYFDPRYLVEFLKKTLTPAAAAFAYNLAMNAFCPSCQSILAKLTDLANMINSLTLNSCQATQLASAWGKYFGNAIANEVGTGHMDSYFVGINEKVSQMKSTINDFFANLCPPGGCAGQKLLDNYSLLQDALSNISALNGDKSSEALFRAVFGDLVAKKPATGNDEDKLPKLKVVTPLYLTKKEEFLKKWIYGDGSTKCDNTGSVELKVLYLDSDMNEYVAPATFTPLCVRVYDTISAIFDKYQNGTSLTQDEVSILASAPLPLVRLLNMLSSKPEILGENLKKKVAAYITAYIADSALDYIYYQSMNLASQIENDETDENTLRTIRFYKRQIRNIKIDTIAEAKKELIEYLDSLKKYFDIETIFADKFAGTDLAGKYFFSKALTR